MSAPLLTAVPAQAAVVNGVTLNRYEAGVLAGINAQRTSRGLPALVVASGTTDVARRWSMHMAGVTALSHNPSLASALSASGSSGWRFLAENVGFAVANDPATMVAAYMNSAPHRANILDPRARYVGIGAFDASVSGFVMAYNTIDFVDSYSSSYGHTREPADAMPYDGGPITTTRTVASFESTWDPRVRTVRSGSGLSSGQPVYSGATTGDDYVRFVTAATSTASSGAVDLLVRLPLDLRRARAVRIRLVSGSADGRALPVEVLVGNRASQVSLGSAVGTATDRDVELALPAAAKRFNDQLRLRVSAARLDTLGSLAAQVASVRLYQVDVLV